MVKSAYLKLLLFYQTEMATWKRVAIFLRIKEIPKDLHQQEADFSFVSRDLKEWRFQWGRSSFQVLGDLTFLPSISTEWTS